MYNHPLLDQFRHQPLSLFMPPSPLSSTSNLPSSPQHPNPFPILLPILVLISTLLFLLLLFLLLLILIRRRRHFGLRSSNRLSLLDNDGPLDLSRPDGADFDGGVDAQERRWLELVSENTRAGYLRAKFFQTHHRPNSLRTDITLSQFLSIQEKGVSAWAFEPDYDSNPSLPILVQSRTEISFLADGAGMAEQEGGGVCVQSNLPLPKLNEVYYFECKIYEKPDGTEMAIGLATKPYPSFRLPGWNRLSIGYFSADGFKSHNYPFTATSYGPPLKQGDVLGVGYRPRSGAVFFTRNGKKLDEAYVGLNRLNLFPTIGATGPGAIHVNLGQAGFVFIEANVKKWGLAPMAGTLAPPPAYGHQYGSILLASAQEQQPCQAEPSHQRTTSRSTQRRRRLVGYSTLDTDPSDGLPHNPPTPRPLDISLRRLNQSTPDSDSDLDDDSHHQHNHNQYEYRSDEDEESEEIDSSELMAPARIDGGNGAASRRREGQHQQQQQQRRRDEVKPPHYAPIDPYKYAAGVAEVMLAEQFQGTTAVATNGSGFSADGFGAGGSRGSLNQGQSQSHSHSHSQSQSQSQLGRHAGNRTNHQQATRTTGYHPVSVGDTDEEDGQ